jgi:large subunit ribosomal protein L21
MYAVIKSGGKQYRVESGESVEVEKLPGEIGDSVTFDKVLMTSDGDTVNVGTPYLENASVVGRITRQEKHKKIVVFKYKRRKGYRKKNGHRQPFTQIVIDQIGA